MHTLHATNESRSFANSAILRKSNFLISKTTIFIIIKLSKRLLLGGVLSCTFRAPDFATFAQICVVPRPIVPVVNVLSKQQVLRVELQGGQHNLIAACEPSRQCQALLVQFNHLQPPVGLTSKLPSFGEHAKRVTHIGQACSFRRAGGQLRVANAELDTCFACRKMPRRRSSARATPGTRHALSQQIAQL